MTDTEWLTLIKTHLRIDVADITDDDYLLQLRNTAAAAAQWQIDAEPTPPTDTDAVEGDGDEPTPTPTTDPPAEIVQAMLLLIGELYARREITGDKATELPKSYDYLIGTHRRYTVC